MDTPESSRPTIAAEDLADDAKARARDLLDAMSAAGWPTDDAERSLVETGIDLGVNAYIGAINEVSKTRTPTIDLVEQPDGQIR